MTDYSYSLSVGGRNIGSHHFRDPANPQFAYHLRETNDSDKIELVKINVETGELVQQGGSWAYATALDELGACFPFPNNNINWDTNITRGMVSGGKLYIAAENQIPSTVTFTSVIVEFDEVTLEVSNSWTHGVAETKGRANGTSVMNADGTIFANGGVNKTAAGLITNCYIQLLKPSNSSYGYVDVLAQLGGVVNWIATFNSPICFDADGFLWFVLQPITVDAGANYISGPSTLYKCSVVDALGALSLTVEGSFAIPDNYFAYGTSDFAQFFNYPRISFDNIAGNKIYLWSFYNQLFFLEPAQGWFLEFDTDSETFTRGPLTWTAGTKTQQRAPLDLIGWTGGVDSLVVAKTTQSIATISLFKIADGVETAYPIEATWTFVDSNKFQYNNWTYVYSQGSFEIYAFDVDLEFIGEEPFQLYHDANFLAADPAVNGTVSFEKQDRDGNLLGGSQFTLHNVDDDTDIFIVDNEAPDENPADGAFLLTEIPPGNYTLTETLAPVNYLLNNTPIEFTVGELEDVVLDPIVDALNVVYMPHPYAMCALALASEIELGPFRYLEQKQADETSLISSLIIGLSEAVISTIEFVDFETDDGDEDYDDEVDVLGDDIFEDWGFGFGFENNFRLELLASEDGMNNELPGPEFLLPITDNGSTKQYSPTGYSAIFHRLKLKTVEVDDNFYVKFVDMAGLMTGRQV